MLAKQFWTLRPAAPRTAVSVQFSLVKLKITENMADQAVR
ncbi:hypothetical protein AVDCRST_MAG84-7596 [uncultured Microcoleus sp.]|uniref:Uncharacterized protein n=1 Tax=uncultured Microcoleus sp. TaxID=259945 RepID=A0A6J4PWE8_9CYAN|nr:hypothetical protein AVDCRST_MAG84-7596 [uncultured Microcoleus sp.]